LEVNFDRFKISQLYKEKEMADFRKWILALTVLVLFAGLASAQVNNGSGGGSALSCSANAAVPPQLRGEGYTELTGDIVINCIGGPTPGTGTVAQGSATGAQIPTANITVYYNGTVTSRLLSTSNTLPQASEALLLVDEPGSGLPGYGPTVPLTVCTSSNQSANACPEFIGNSSLGGVNVPVQATAASTVAGWNAFQGSVNTSSVTFFGVPILAPGTTGTRVFRITNVRINANGITGGGSIPANVTASVSISGSTGIPLNNPQVTTGFVVPASVVTDIRAFGGGSSVTGQVTQPLQCNNPQNTAGNGTILGQADIRFREQFGTAWKTRVMPSTFAGPGISPPLNPQAGGGTGQSASAVQNIPGYVYNSESGFIVSSLTGGNSTAGLADFGTRVFATFNNIPTGMAVYVSDRNIITGTSTPTSITVATAGTSYAVLVGTSAGSENALEGGQNPTLAATGTTANGYGTNQLSPKLNYVSLPIVNGSATAVWEIVNTYPSINETLEFPVWVGYTPSPGTNSPPTGTMTVNAGYAPNPTSGLFTTAQGSVARWDLNVPRFADTSTALNLAQVTICSTSLLFPYVTNQAGFDTGIAIANTSVDPFGTGAQAGTCSLNWYGTGSPAATTLGAGGPGTTTNIAGGTVVTALASTTVPGFQGYMIAVCNFQFAHGFAFVSDLGARNLAMGYLALIMNAPSGNYRPTGSAEELVF